MFAQAGRGRETWRAGTRIPRHRHVSDVVEYAICFALIAMWS